MLRTYSNETVSVLTNFTVFNDYTISFWMRFEKEKPGDFVFFNFLTSVNKISES